MGKNFKISVLSRKNFKRSTGISHENFEYLVARLQRHFDMAKQKKPMKKRGRKGAFSLEDKLLLTLYYLRHYPTFELLGQFFGISESYANKIYHHTSGNLVKILHVSSRKKLMAAELKAVIIDVSEQPIERPKKGQRAWYSGKKKVIR